METSLLSGQSMVKEASVDLWAASGPVAIVALYGNKPFLSGQSMLKEASLDLQAASRPLCGVAIGFLCGNRHFGVSKKHGGCPRAFMWGCYRVFYMETCLFEWAKHAQRGFFGPLGCLRP